MDFDECTLGTDEMDNGYNIDDMYNQRLKNNNNNNNNLRKLHQILLKSILFSFNSYLVAVTDLQTRYFQEKRIKKIKSYHGLFHHFGKWNQ